MEGVWRVDNYSVKLVVLNFNLRLLGLSKYEFRCFKHHSGIIDSVLLDNALVCNRTTAFVTSGI
jgi:hypothetical protein